MLGRVLPLKKALLDTSNENFFICALYDPGQDVYLVYAKVYNLLKWLRNFSIVPIL